MEMFHYAHHLLDMLFLGLIPWWLYVVVSIAAAIIILFELPTRMGLIIGLGVALIFGDFGFTAKGYQMGRAQEREAWVANAAHEKQRLADGMKAQLDAETARADLAETQNANLRQERDDAVSSAGPDRQGSPVVIPPGVALKLFHIGHSQRSNLGRPHGTPRHSRGAPGVPRLLLPHIQPASA